MKNNNNNDSRSNNNTGNRVARRLPRSEHPQKTAERVIKQMTPNTTKIVAPVPFFITDD